MLEIPIRRVHGVLIYSHKRYPSGYRAEIVTLEASAAPKRSTLSHASQTLNGRKAELN